MENNHSKLDLGEIPTPVEMKKFLDEYIIGQDEAKKKICVAVYNHYKRLKSNQAVDDVDIEKSNVIIVGPTGTGKCVAGDSVVTIMDSHTGQVFDITIDDFIEKYLKE
jgi:ATP-dependent Clp protease ATP-binding subunit ClpX